MPILHAEIQVGGRRAPFAAGSFSFWQITDYEGRPSTDVRLGLIELLLVGEEAAWVFWEEWMLDAHRRQSGRLVFFHNEGQTAKTVIFYDAFCVHYECRFDARGQNRQGSFETRVFLSAAAEEVQGQFSEAHSVIPWAADEATRRRALTKPTDVLPSAALAAARVSEHEQTDFMRFEKAKRPLSERPQSPKTGYLGSPRLSRRELKELSKKLAAINVELIVDKKGILPDFARAGFDPTSGKMYLRKGATHFEAFHETQHAKQWAELGLIPYQQQNRFEREKYVFDKIVENQHLFSASEMTAATKYIESLI